MHSLHPDTALYSLAHGVGGFPRQFAIFVEGNCSKTSSYIYNNRCRFVIHIVDFQIKGWHYTSP